MSADMDLDPGETTESDQSQRQKTNTRSSSNSVSRANPSSSKMSVQQTAKFKQDKGKVSNTISIAAKRSEEVAKVTHQRVDNVISEQLNIGEQSNVSPKQQFTTIQQQQNALMEQMYDLQLKQDLFEEQQKAFLAHQDEQLIEINRKHAENMKWEERLKKQQSELQRQKPMVPGSSLQETGTSTSNYYENLSIGEYDMDDDQEQSAIEKLKKFNSKQSTINKSPTKKKEDTLNSKPSNTLPKKVKIPAILVFDSQPKLISNALRSENINNFELIHNKGKHIIKPTTVEEHSKIMATLSSANTQLYSFTPSSLRNQNILMRGVSGDYSDEEVKQLLISQLPEEFELINVRRYSTPRSRSNQHTLALHTITIGPGADMAAIKSIRAIDYLRVSFEVTRKTDITQCYRCQRPGHTSTNCHMDYRCVKCKNTHLPGECALTKGQNTTAELYCHNCESHGHPASFRGCPKMQEHLKRLHEKQRKVRERRDFQLHSANTYTRNNVSYADAARQNTTQNKENMQDAITKAVESAMSKILQPVHSALEKLSGNISTIFNIIGRSTY